MAKTLELLFLDTTGNTVRIPVEYPLEPVDEAKVAQVMATVLTQNIFRYSEGGELFNKKGARLIERVVEDIPVL